MDRQDFLKTLAEAKAERIVQEERLRLGWNSGELMARRRSDPGKLTIAERLRKETTLSIIAIASRVYLGTSKSANARLHSWMKQNLPVRKADHGGSGA